MVAIYAVSALPTAPLSPDVSDKSAHLLAYFGLAALAARAAAGGFGAAVTMRVALVALVLASGYGAFDEWHQSFVPGRFSDVGDWYADAIGAIIGVGACWAWGIMASRPEA
jgi:VanZ family protein